MNGFLASLLTLLQLRFYNVRTGYGTHPVGTGGFTPDLDR
jgi:hypothetical protein